MKTELVLMALALLATGCGRKQPAADAPAPKSTTQTLIDGATGRTAVRAGQKARQEIERISAKRDRDLNDILKEE